MQAEAEEKPEAAAEDAAAEDPAEGEENDRADAEEAAPVEPESPQKAAAKAKVSCPPPASMSLPKSTHLRRLFPDCHSGKICS